MGPAITATADIATTAAGSRPERALDSRHVPLGVSAARLARVRSACRHARELARLWGSGSKSALAAAILITLAAALTAAHESPRLHRRQTVFVVGLAAVIVGSVIVLGIASSRSSNPAARMWRDLGAATPRAFILQLWNRNGFGSAATTLIRTYPVAGVGVGRFQSLVSAFPRHDGQPLPPDNAQNWLRHQVAELGFAGGLGWIAWCVTFAAFVVIPRAGESRAILTARSMLIAFGFISLLGMPGQDLMVTVTFWATAFWYVTLSGYPVRAGSSRAWHWVFGGLVLSAFAVVSSMTAPADLRLPTRARLTNTPFSYGFAMPGTAGTMNGYRVTQVRAAALVPVAGPWMAVSVYLDESRAGGQPVDVRIWKDGEVVLKARLDSAEPLTGFVRVDDTVARVLLESSARKAGEWWSPPIARDIGLRTKWTFVETVPPGFKSHRRAFAR